MKKNIIKFSMLIMFVFTFCFPCFASNNAGQYNFQPDRTVTEDTTEFLVLFSNEGFIDSPQWKNASFYVTTSDNHVLFKKKCLTEGNINVTIKKQKAGTVLKIFLKSSDGISNIKKVSVKKLSSILPERASKKVNPGKVCLRNGECYISGKKGDTFIVRNRKKVLRKIRFTKTDTIKVPISDYTTASAIYIYNTKGKYRSYKYKVIPQTFYIFE